MAGRLKVKDHIRAAGVVTLLTAVIVGALSALGWWWGYDNTNDVPLPQIQGAEDPASKEARERWEALQRDGG